MMRYLLLFAMSALLSFPAQSQNIGVKALAGYSILYGNSEEVDGMSIENSAFRPGYGIGLVSDFNADGFIGIRFELLYELRRSYNEVDYSGTFLGTSYEISNSTANRFQMINLPILLSLNIGNLSLYAGPNISYTFAGQGDITRQYRAETADGSVITDIDLEAEDIDYFGDNSDRNFRDYSDNPAVNTFNVGANIGLIFNITDFLELDFRLYHSLTDFTDNEYDRSVVNPQENRTDVDNWTGMQLSIAIVI